VLFRSITPHFEYTEVFSRGIGENSEIVQKEMFTFKDKKGRSLTLRPEGTASVVRAVVEKKLYSQELPLKLFYIGNMFRYERPQKGRMREFFQIGVESIGSNNPAIDAEVIWLIFLFFKELGFANLKLMINSIGCTKCRKEYIKKLERYLLPLKKDMCEECNARIGKNTLRVFDCKSAKCKEILRDAVKISDSLCNDCLIHFNNVKSLLEVLEIDYMHDKNLVRGFDYYTRTIFEVISPEINSTQNALGGGGRYDDLIKEFGGPQLSSVGFAIGAERTIMLMKELGIKIPENNNDKGKTYIVSMDLKYNKYLFEIVKFLRTSGVSCDINFNIKNIGKEIKSAQSNGFDNAIIIGEEEYEKQKLTIKRLKDFSQHEFCWKSEKEKIINFLIKME
jgi:histidyl-tRNA synthetase